MEAERKFLPAGRGRSAGNVREPHAAALAGGFACSGGREDGIAQPRCLRGLLAGGVKPGTRAEYDALDGHPSRGSRRRVVAATWGRGRGSICRTTGARAFLVHPPDGHCRKIYGLVARIHSAGYFGRKCSSAWRKIAPGG